MRVNHEHLMAAPSNSKARLVKVPSQTALNLKPLNPEPLNGP